MIDVVIIDDEIWVARLIANLIDWQAYGFRIVQVYHDGEEGLAGIRSLRPQLVLTDIRMPGITGLDIIREIQKTDLDTLFVIISGFNDFDYAKAALTYGAIGYLLKPIDQNELIKVVDKARSMLRQRQFTQQVQQRLEQAMGQTMEKLREQTFLNLFEGLGDTDPKRINATLHMGLSPGWFQVVGVTIEGEGRVGEMTELVTRGVWEASLPANCIELASLPMGAEVYLILNYHPEAEEEIDCALERLLQEILSHRPPYNVTIGVGEPVDTLDQLHCSYHSAREMQMARLVCGPDRIYDCRKLPRTVQDERQLLYPSFDLSLRQAFDAGDLKGIQRLTGQAVDLFLSKARKHPSLLLRGINRLLTLYTASVPLDVQRRQEYISEKLRQLCKAKTVSEIKEMLRAFAGELLTSRGADMEKAHRSAIQRALSYIDSNYMHDLSLGEVSQMVHLSPNYFSEIFKKEAGVNFKEYLVNKRITVAKELIRNPGYKLAEISSLVGYNNSNNFAKAFKKTVGVKPSDYRKLMIGNG